MNNKKVVVVCLVLWHVGLTADQKFAWIAHMRTAHPAFVQQVLESYKKNPDYFDVLIISEFALGGEVLATFVGEVLLGLEGPSLTVAVGKNVELVTDADILVLRDIGILHLDVVQALLAEREGARVHPAQTVPFFSEDADAAAVSAADAAVRVADADTEMKHACSHCAVMARFLQDKFGRVRVLREQIVLGQGDVSAARHELEAIVTELDAFLLKRQPRENKVQQETGEALLALHKQVVTLARIKLTSVTSVSSDDVRKELAEAREEVQKRIAELEQRGASDAKHPEHEAWFALMDLKETIAAIAEHVNLISFFDYLQKNNRATDIRVLSYLLAVAQSLGTAAQKNKNAGKYSFIGGLAIFAHLYKTYGLEKLRVWRGSHDLDIFSQQDDVKKTIEARFKLHGDRPAGVSRSAGFSITNSGLPTKFKIYIKDKKEIEREASGAQPVGAMGADYYYSQKGNVMFAGSEIPPDFWTSVNTINLFGISLHVASLDWLLDFKLRVPFDTVKTERPQDLVDVVNILSVMYQSGASGNSLKNRLTDAQLDILRQHLHLLADNPSFFLNVVMPDRPGFSAFLGELEK